MKASSGWAVLLLALCLLPAEAAEEVAAPAAAAKAKAVEKAPAPPPPAAVYEVPPGGRDPFALPSAQTSTPDATAVPASPEAGGAPAGTAPVPVAAAPAGPGPAEVGAALLLSGVFGDGKGGGVAIVNETLREAGKAFDAPVGGQTVSVTLVRIEGDPPRVVFRVGQTEFTRIPGANEEKGVQR